jgi:AbrB family looped-hinge helix DNA binding protein
MGNNVGMGENMGKVEIDERGRFTLPAKIRDKLLIKAGDKLTIKVDSNNKITLQKSPSKEIIFKELVGCIKTIEEEKPTPESIKGIWKTNP